jgi:ectoine hydroxylase-related dioxygenase (phytanoyl-CoA dioxygenase family)
LYGGSKKSHKSGKFSNRKSKKIIPITGNPGDLIIWDSRLWHGTLENKNNTSRWAIVLTLSSWWIKQAMDMPKSLPKNIYKKCNNLEKQLLGFCSEPPLNEKIRINTKGGYEVLS